MAALTWPDDGGYLERYHLRGLYTPPTDGLYPVIISFDRPYAQFDLLSTIADDLLIIPADSPSPPLVTGTGSFTNGTWRGTLMVSGPATNLYLRADDGAGHVGHSRTFVVTLKPTSTPTACPMSGSDATSARSTRPTAARAPTPTATG